MRGGGAEDYAKKCYENRLRYDPVLVHTDARKFKTNR